MSTGQITTRKALTLADTDVIARAAETEATQRGERIGSRCYTSSMRGTQAFTRSSSGYRSIVACCTKRRSSWRK